VGLEFVVAGCQAIPGGKPVRSRVAVPLPPMDAAGPTRRDVLTDAYSHAKIAGGTAVSNRSITDGANANGSYSSANGVELYYEITGAGAPLLLLHGGVGASEMFAPVMPALVEGRQLVAVHLQGHGRSTDNDLPLSFESMADDVAALTRHLGMDRADVMGYSLGGGVALQMTIRHPDLVRRLVVVSAPAKRQGFYPEELRGMSEMGPEAAKYMPQSPLEALYPGKDWATLFTRLAQLLGREYDWSAEVAKIASPVMLVYADADAIRTTHIMEFFGLLGGGQKGAGLDGSQRPKARLAILPGQTHYDVLTAPSLGGLVLSFLDAPVPGTA